MPALTPETIPIVPSIVALPLLALHVPPDVESVSVVVVPIHMIDIPLIAAASGFTVTVIVAGEPQPLS
jgi:hypothetical protein